MNAGYRVSSVVSRPETRVGYEVRGAPTGVRATIRDVARAAGTSPALVSRYLTGNQPVSEASAARIRAAIETLDYRPSVTARNLRLRRTGLVALVIPYLNNPLYSLHATGAERELAKAGMLVVVCSTRTKPDGTYLGRSFFEALGTGRVDGALIFPYQEEVDDLIALRAQGTPVVLIDRVPPLRPSTTAFDAVTVNNEGAVHDATARLLAQGRRRVGLVSLRADSLSGAPRLAGYRRALAGAGVPFEPGLVALGDGSDVGGGSLLASLLDGPMSPDAVVVATTLQTRGALDVIRRRQISVPGEIAVIGYRHDQSVLWPEIPTFRYPGEALGEAAARVLLRRLQGPEADGPVHEMLDLEFVNPSAG